MWIDKGNKKYYGKFVFTLSDSEEIKIADSSQWLCLFIVIGLALITWLLGGKNFFCKKVWEVDLLYHRPVLSAVSSLGTKRCSVWRKFFEGMPAHTWKYKQGTNTVCLFVYSYICTWVSPRITDSQSRKLSLFHMTASLSVFLYSSCALFLHLTLTISKSLAIISVQNKLLTSYGKYQASCKSCDWFPNSNVCNCSKA